MLAGIEVLSMVPSEKRQEFIQSFKILPHFEGYKDNCVFYKLFEDVEELNRFMWVEHWQSEDALEEYLQSDRFKTILGAIEAMGELIYFNRIEVKETEE